MPGLATPQITLVAYRDGMMGRKKPATQQGHGVPGVKKSTCEKRQGTRRLVLHEFYDFSRPQPLNRSVSRNPEYHGFWIKLGVSGFRMDAVPFVIAMGAKVKVRSRNTTCC